MKKISYFIFLLSFSANCFAQTLDLKFKMLNNDIVISSNASPYVFKDSKGLVWISTIDGVNIYDGQNVEIYKQNIESSGNKGLGGNIIQGSFFEDKNSDIWFTSYNGINCYRRSKKTFEHYYLFDENGKQYDINYKGVFLAKNDIFWIQIKNTDSAILYSFNIKNLSQNKIGDFASTRIEIFETNSSINVLNYQKGNGLIWYDIQDNRIKQQRKIVNDFLSDNEIVEDILWLNNRIYFTTNKGFYSCDLVTKKVDVVISRNFSKILHLNNRQFLLASITGITLFDFSNNTIVKEFSNEDMGITKPITCLYLDNEGGLWATNEFDRGNIYFANTKKKSFSTLYTNNKQAFSSKILCLGNNNEIIALNEKVNKITTLNALSKKIVKEINLPKEEKKNHYSICTDVNNNIYYSSGRSLFQYNNTEKKWKSILMSNKLDIWNIQKINGSRIITCTNNGLYEIKGTKLHKFEIFNHKVSDISYIFQDSKGYIHFSQDANDYYIAKFVSHNSLEIFKKISLNGFFTGHWENPQANEIWLATNLGIAALNTNNYEITLYGEKKGLRNQFVSAIYPDHADNLWATTSQGILSFNIKTKQNIHFDKSDGLITENFIPNNSVTTQNNELWFGGENATIFFNPDSIKSSTYQAPIHIRTFKVNDIERKDINLNNYSEVNLNYNENTFNLQLLAIDFANPLKTKIAYFLEGWDMKWDTSLSANGFIRYSNLSSGQYYLYLASCNADGVWAKEFKRIPIYIKPPFYKTWWFISLCVGLLLGITYYLYLRQIRRVRTAERLKGEYNTTLINSELKALKAQINPHFFNNCLNSISNFILKNDTDNAFFYLTKFSRLVRLVLEHSNVNFIKLSDEITALTYYLEMESLRFSSKFEYKIEIHENLDTNIMLVSPMLIQPFVENAIWHGLLPKQGGIVVVFFEREENYVKCTIQDNGIGRVKSSENKSSLTSKRKSYGMTLIQDRLELLYHTDKNKPKDIIQIIDMYDDDEKSLGTKIIVTIPTQIHSTQNAN